MKKITFNVLFRVRRYRINTEGKAPIYLRVTLNKNRKEVSLNMSVDYKNGILKTRN